MGHSVPATVDPPSALQMTDQTPTLRPIGYVRSELSSRKGAPRQPGEDAPPAWIDLESEFAAGFANLTADQTVLLLTWLHEADRSTLEVYPRNQGDRLHGVFSTRSPDRPNPIGIHRVTITEIDLPSRFRVDGLEAIDGTPVVDIKPVLDPGREC